MPQVKVFSANFRVAADSKSSSSPETDPENFVGDMQF